jgi:hypothetical protein
MVTPRINLQVPFSEKEEAKRLGAAWDPQPKTWYVPEGVGSALLRKWIPEPQSPNIRAHHWYLATSKRECWRCSQQTSVLGIILPGGHEVLWVADDPLWVFATRPVRSKINACAVW